MWNYFESDYNLFIKRNRKPSMKDFPKSELEAFFKKCLECCAQYDSSRESKTIQAGTGQVELYLVSRDINSAFTVALWTYSWIEAEGKFAHVFKLLFLLTSSNVKAFPDEGLRGTIATFTQQILQSILSRESGIGVSWMTMSMEELNRLLILLGGEKSWPFMLIIVQWLWDQRCENDDTWTPDLVTAIGRRLCDTYMALNRKGEALKLCERIHYNYKRVFGELNPQTLQFADLLAQLYTSTLHYDKAMILCEKVLQALANSTDKPSELKKGQEVDIIFRQLNILKYSRSMKGSWQNSEESYISLVSQLHVLYMQKHSRWDEIADFKFWSAKAVSNKDGPFTWEPPVIWNILEDESIIWKGGVPSIAETPRSMPGIRSPKRLSRINGSFSERELLERETEFEKFSKTTFKHLFSD
ncbi:hypothetical protein TWF718_005207 [Orbilia javanica]|uniref:Uncharacterized protein n=1 Tax=Orbilia javanica TaxID=47235 RepID=A0AAN8RLN7_9PEZI